MAEHVPASAEPPCRLPGTILAHPGTEYQPIHPILVVEAEAGPLVERSVHAWAAAPGRNAVAGTNCPFKLLG